MKKKPQTLIYIIHQPTTLSAMDLPICIPYLATVMLWAKSVQCTLSLISHIQISTNYYHLYYYSAKTALVVAHSRSFI